MTICQCVYGFSLLVLLCVSGVTQATSEATPDEQLYRLLALQRQIDIYAPISETHLQGTHNSYNSDAYRHLLRYYDTQQHLSIGEQLHNGARFIELDIHWTFNATTLKHDLLLCHGVSRWSLPFLHWGCSAYDLPLKHALLEIAQWLEQNPQEVFVLYLEDHSNGEHEYLYQLLVETGIQQHIYASGGCVGIPDALTKYDVLNSGKRIILWKDELRMGGKNIFCGENKNIAELAFNDLNGLNRKAEDRTRFGSLHKFLAQGRWPRITADEVREYLLNGTNILNLDDFKINDERLYQYLWSWNLNTDLNQHAACAYLDEYEGWNLTSCETAKAVACYHSEQKSWHVALSTVTFSDAQSACAQLGSEFNFSAPANILENKNLMLAMREASVKQVWLHIQYNQDFGIEVGDRRKYHTNTQHE